MSCNRNDGLFSGKDIRRYAATNNRVSQIILLGGRTKWGGKTTYLVTGNPWTSILEETNVELLELVTV
jgi:hypothetical protein